MVRNHAPDNRVACLVISGEFFLLVIHQPPALTDKLHFLAGIIGLHG